MFIFNFYVFHLLFFDFCFPLLLTNGILYFQGFVVFMYCWLDMVYGPPPQDAKLITVLNAIKIKQMDIKAGLVHVETFYK